MKNRNEVNNNNKVIIGSYLAKVIVIKLTTLNLFAHTDFNQRTAMNIQKDQ